MPDEAPARLAAETARLIGRAVGAGERFGIAVSGGPDSMALLWLAHRAWPGRVEAATVDHGLRAESAAEADMVARWCADAAIPHRILRPDRPIAGSIQAAARAARYALLECWADERGIDWLMTAHHADDQLETMLMRLNRGSGVAGLAGVRGCGGRVLRPLLGWRRAELKALAVQAAMPFVNDPSNEDERFDRVAIRKVLADVHWIDSIAASRSAAALAEAEDALCWLTGDIFARFVEQTDGEVRLTRTDLPREALRRLLLRMVALVDPEAAPRGDSVDQAIVQLLAGKRLTIGNALAQGGDIWKVRRAPPRRAGGPR